MNIFLYAVFPYISLAVFVIGLIWRYKYDKFGWTTRSSQVYEKRWLRWASPLFHYGILIAAAGHVMGLVIPKSFTALFVEEHVYHIFAVAGGLVSGAMLTVGYIILIIRRIIVKSVRHSTSVNDVVMYIVLTATIFFGMWNTISTALADESAGAEHVFHYREHVSPWFRGIFMLHPDPSLMEHAPLQFQAHAFLAFLLFLIWPFTKLVHVFSAPVQYFVRPYIVYRSRDGVSSARNSHSHAPEGMWRAPTSAADHRPRNPIDGPRLRGNRHRGV